MPEKSYSQFSAASLGQELTVEQRAVLESAGVYGNPTTHPNEDGGGGGQSATYLTV